MFDGLILGKKVGNSGLIRRFLGRKIEGKRFLNQLKEEKEILEQELLNLEKRFTGVKVDWSTIMKNHIHIIIFLNNSTVSLSRVIQVFKSITNLRMKNIGHKDVFWQRNYYEHVIRNEEVLTKIREYIENNPLAEMLKIEEIYNKVEQARPLQFM